MLPLYVKSTPAIFKTFLLSAGRYTFFLYFYPTIFVTRGHVCRYAIHNDENRRLFHPHVLKGQCLVGYPQRVVKGDSSRKRRLKKLFLRALGARR